MLGEHPEVNLRIDADDLISREIREQSAYRWAGGLVGVYHQDQLQAVLGIDSTVAPLRIDDDDDDGVPDEPLPASEWCQ